jgi:hypothetical protein
MSWYLRKSWLPRVKSTGIAAIKPTTPTEPIQRAKPIRLTQPIKPIAPIGFQYSWKDD